MRWPYQCHPREDELLSSWILRTAHGNFLKPWVFAHGLWQLRPPVLSRDIDLLHVEHLVADMAEGTGTSLARAAETSLASLEGTLFAEYISGARTSLIMPIGIRGRSRRRFGLQFCPECLADPDTRFFRRSWRIALITVCRRHGRQLSDRCPSCGEAATPHRSTALHLCGGCGADLSQAVASSQPLLPWAMSLTVQIEAALSRGWAVLGDDVMPMASSYFAVIRQIARVILSGSRSDNLRRTIAEHTGMCSKPFTAAVRHAEIEWLDVAERHRLVAFVGAALAGWPAMLVAYCSEAKVWKTWLLRDREDPPYALWSAASSYLDRSTYSPNRMEVESAAAFLRSNGQLATKANLLRLVGDSNLRAAAADARPPPRRPAAKREAPATRRT